MKIDGELLNKLEKLSAIIIQDDKRAQIKDQLSEIVGFVEVLNELDMKELKTNLETKKLPFRKDEPKSSEVIEALLKHSPAQKEHFFLVPKIIE